MEKKSTEEVAAHLRVLCAIQFRNLEFQEVAGKQIMSAMLHESGLRYAEKLLYKVLQGAANEARRRTLLINPTPRGETYSAAVGNTSRMQASEHGWEMTKGILWRHVYDAKRFLRKILDSRKRRTFHRAPEAPAGVSEFQMRQPEVP